jgi:SAM-dependent methyltransferase
MTGRASGSILKGKSWREVDSERTPQEWHTWFSIQANWTKETRQWLYQEAEVAKASKVLEVGCGTGAITQDIARLGTVRAVGLDIDSGMLAYARRQGDDVELVQGDAHVLPFSNSSFDVVVCHYLLLWLADPAAGVREMARVVRPGGHVLACAEPDYGGRIDHPPELVRLGQLQAQALSRQGAEPEMGRRLGALFAVAGLQATVGTMAGQWNAPAPEDADFAAEWKIREHDLNGLIAPKELKRLRDIDRRALKNGARTLFVPTFYALGKKPN